MKRRQFITLLSSAALMQPLASRAQQTAMPVVGFLHSETAATTQLPLAAFLQGVREGGYVVGQNLAIEYRWAEGNVRSPLL